MIVSKLLNQFSLAQKSAISPLVFIICIIAVVIIGSRALSGVNAEVSRINTDLGPDANITTDLIDAMYNLRIQMKNFVADSTTTNYQQFSQATSQFDNILLEATSNIQNSDRVQLLSQIKDAKAEYVALFETQVAPSAFAQNELVDSVLDVKGTQARKALSEISQTAYVDGDIEAAFYGGLAQQHLLLARTYAYRYLDNNTPAYAERVSLEVDKTQGAMRDLLVELQNANRRALAQQVIGLMQEFGAGFNEVVGLMNTINTTVVRLDELGPQAALNSRDISKSVLASLTQQGEKVATDVASTQTILMIAAVIAILIGALISLLVVNGMLRPINQTITMLKDIAEGDGDLTKRLTVSSQDEIGQLATNFNIFVEKIQGIIGEIIGATHALGHASSELSVASEQTKKGVEQQEAAIQDVLLHSQELSVTVDEVHRNADIATDEASGTKDSAGDVMDVVTGAVTAINQLVTELNDSNETFERLQGESEKINNVLTLITNITEQINLLALNAAIEAARAGEAGRGFAVVADEVRKLAQKTQESTGEIESLTTSLLEVTAQASRSMQSSCKMAENTASQSLQAKVSLASISDKVSVITQKNSDIKIATEQQTNAVGQVANQVQLISNVADETRESSIRSTEATLQLATLSKKLESMVGQFRVQ